MSIVGSLISNSDTEIKPGEPVLDWPTRKRVALGRARGLEYLHERCNPKIFHRDVKAANVLLDEDFEAVVRDFGLAKLVELVDVRKTNVVTQVCGTLGHIAPEHLSTGKSSVKTDVYGYGVTLLEVVTGQRAIDFSFLAEEDEALFDRPHKQQSPGYRPAMSEVVRMLGGEGLAERFLVGRSVRDHREDSVYNQDVIELSCGS